MKFKRQYIAGVLMIAASLVIDVRMTLDAAAAPTPSAMQDSQQTAPDNTRANKDSTAPTADQQKSDAADREITKKIRAALHSDASLSTYAHNVKIITQNGRVTLRGPVRSQDEKTNVEAKAEAVVGAGNVDDRLEVAQKQ